MKKGDKVKLINDHFGYIGSQIGEIVESDVKVARAYEMGYNSCGIVRALFPSGHLVETHFSNYELIKEGAD